MKKFLLAFVMPEEVANYVEACARIRGISVPRLLRRIVTAACQDRLIESILDDDGAKVSVRPHSDKSLSTEFRTYFPADRKTPRSVNPGAIS